MIQDSWATAKLQCSLEENQGTKQGDRQRTTWPDTTRYPRSCCWYFLSNHIFFIFPVDSSVNSEVGDKASVCEDEVLVFASWCGEQGEQTKEFKASLNTVVMDKVWQEEFLPQNHTCFKHCFQWCAFAVWGSLTPDVLLCMHPCGNGH